MKNYLNIITKIRDTPWLMIPESLSVLLQIVESHLDGSISEEEIRTRLEASDSYGAGASTNNQDGIGVIPIYGPIFGRANLMTELSGATSLETFQKDFNAMLNDGTVHSILLDVDSPGGTADLVPETADLIYNADKPVYAIANGMAASAAYWLASQAGQLYSTRSGAVGNVGAYAVHEDRSGADQQAGRRFTFISAGPYKTEGNPHEPLTADAKDYRQQIINDLYQEFLDVVARGRNIEASDFGGGRMMPSSMALDQKLIDGVATFDQLIASIEPPKPMGTISLAVATTKTRLESKEWEHSEPGTGIPPTPRRDEDNSDSKDIVTGSRRDPLPLDPNDPNAPKARSNMPDVEVIEELQTLLGAEDVVGAVKALMDEVTPLREAIAASTEETEFAKKYPGIYAEHQKLRTTNLAAEAKDFVDSISSFKSPTGTSTRIGLSAVARDEIGTMYIKFATGVASLDDFKAVIETISNGGTLEYGERGSAVAAADPEAVDTSTREGLQQARLMFAQKVRERMVADNLDRKAAIEITGKDYPHLAEAYARAGVDR